MIQRQIFHSTLFGFAIALPIVFLQRPLIAQDVGTPAVGEDSETGVVTGVADRVLVGLRLPQGEVRDQAMTAMDWFPTVLELCGIRPPESVIFDGHSLLPIIDQNADSDYGVMHWQWQEHWCVREGDWKLISDRDGLQLVSLSGEEPERIDHAGEHPELVARFRALHEAWIAEIEQERNR